MSFAIPFTSPRQPRTKRRRGLAGLGLMLAIALSIGGSLAAFAPAQSASAAGVLNLRAAVTGPAQAQVTFYHPTGNHNYRVWIVNADTGVRNDGVSLSGPWSWAGDYTVRLDVPSEGGRYRALVEDSDVLDGPATVSEYSTVITIQPWVWSVTSQPDVTKALVSWAVWPGTAEYNYRFRLPETIASYVPWNRVDPSVTSAEVSGLTPGTTYIFEIYPQYPNAHNGGRKEKTFVVPYPTPTAVTAVAGNASATLTWTAPNPAPSGLSYRIDYRVQGSSTWSTQASATTSATVGSLVNGSTYEFRVASLASGVEQGVSSTVTATPITIPARPILRVWPLDGAVEVAASITSTPGAPAAAADVLYQVSPTGANTWRSDYPILSRGQDNGLWISTISGLQNGQSYDVRAYTRNAAGSSAAPSTIVSTTPFRSPDAPALSTPVQGLNKFTVGATFPTSVAAPGGQEQWQIGVVRNGAVADADWAVASPTQATPGQYTFASGLSAGTEYRVRARGINDNGAGTWSTSSTVRVITTPTTPTIQTAPSGDGLLKVTVDFGATDAAPSDTSRANWQVSTDGGANWVGVTARESAGTWVIDGRTNGTDHVVRVQGVNAVATGAWSAASSTTTPHAPPAPLSFGPVTIGSGWASAAITQPSTTVAPSTGSSWRLRKWTSATESTIITDIAFSLDDGVARFGNLENGAVYSMEGRASGPSGFSEWTQSDRFTPLGLPAQPTLGTVTPGDGDITVRAAFPTSVGAPSDADDAQWSISEDGGPFVSTSVSEIHAGVFLIDGLTNGTSYRVRVASSNSIGASLPVFTSSVTPVASPADPAITALRALDGGVLVSAELPNSASAPAATVTWQVAVVAFRAAVTGDPTSDGPPSAGLLAEDPTITPGNGWTQSLGSWSQVTPVLVDGRYRIDGLVNGSTYRVRVATGNATGASSWAASSNATPTGLPVTPIFDAAGPQDSGMAAALRGTSTAALPVDALDWQIALVHGADAGRWKPVAAAALSDLAVGGIQAAYGYGIAGLTNGTEYQLRVRARNDRGSSSWVAWSETVTPVSTATPGELPQPAPQPNPPVAPGPDTDGDGVPNSDDPDVDGDGIPNATDPDIDGDGVANVFDPDVDGDGIPNASDPDADGDRVPNASDPTPLGIGTTTDIDGDGIPNWSDPDMDGDGVANVFDPDIDGDGIPNGTDPTPAGPGSQPGDTGTGTVNDIDGDGIPNATDPDVDGDGLANVFDPDVDGDGTKNADDLDADGDGVLNGADSTPLGIGTPADVDGDGIPNGSDPDIDGDGIVNVLDPDIDGDGIPNATDPTPAGQGTEPGDTGVGRSDDLDGDGIPNATDPDVDGDGVANVFDPDVDGDGTLNGSDNDADGDTVPNASDSTPLGIGTLTDIDGDGIPNGSDADMDGDGVANVFDPDIDGDGIPNGIDPTPAGPGSQSGDTGIGTINDIDGDGILNATDPDVDGDGIANVFDPNVDGDATRNEDDADADGDGTPNGSDSTPLGVGTLTDIDGDGIPNESDPDIDGDGIVNVLDPDIDGDGIPNADDETPAGPGSQPGSTGPGRPGDIDGDGIPDQIDDDIDGDGIPNAIDPDVDGDGIPNGSDPDVDGDGIPNGSDSDVDGDGYPNQQDDDIDGDGIPNATDPDVDGDGIPNGSDPDVDGDGIPNGSDPDVDGDGIVNVNDPDVDGDGIPNGTDPDADGDGIPNAGDTTPNGIGTEQDLDGDGIPNGEDTDMDGDGRNNADDGDIDGDGIPNGSDTTPAGPGSVSGDTGPGTSTDSDGDGIPNGQDPDVDGDGIPNGLDPDMDGDGIPNGLDPDVDGDGIPNGQDPDVDGDGIPNGSDPDIDGDGIANVFDPDVDGDGIPNSSDPDIDGDGIPNGVDPTPNGTGSLGDIDGDGIPNDRDGDVDGDGIPNHQDGDIDGDGIPNAQDPDMDGDGIPNGSDPSQNGPERDIALPTATTSTAVKAKSSAKSGAAAAQATAPTSQNILLSKGATSTRSASSDTATAAPAAETESNSPADLTAQLVLGSFSLLILLAGAWFLLDRRRRRQES